MLSIELLNVKDAFGTWEASNLSETSSSQHGSNDVIWHISSFRTCAGHKNSRGPREISRQGKPHSPTHMRVNQTSDYICAYIYIIDAIYIYIYSIYIYIVCIYSSKNIYSIAWSFNPINSSFRRVPIRNGKILQVGGVDESA